MRKARMSARHTLRRGQCSWGSSYLVRIQTMIPQAISAIVSARDGREYQCLRARASRSIDHTEVGRRQRTSWSSLRGCGRCSGALRRSERATRIAERCSARGRRQASSLG